MLYLNGFEFWRSFNLDTVYNRQCRFGYNKEGLSEHKSIGILLQIKKKEIWLLSDDEKCTELNEDSIKQRYHG